MGGPILTLEGCGAKSPRLSAFTPYGGSGSLCAVRGFKPRSHLMRVSPVEALAGRWEHDMRKTASITAAVVGIVMAIAGVVTWVVVSTTLADQKITVSDDARCAAGDGVNGPISAYCQADIIDHHTKKITGGKTYAELDQDDPNRAVAMDSAFLQASLFTSVVAFGVAGMAFVLGIVLTLIGLALRAPATSKT